MNAATKTDFTLDSLLCLYIFRTKHSECQMSVVNPESFDIEEATAYLDIPGMGFHSSSKKLSAEVVLEKTGDEIKGIEKIISYVRFAKEWGEAGLGEMLWQSEKEEASYRPSILHVFNAMKYCRLNHNAVFAKIFFMFDEALNEDASFLHRRAKDYFVASFPEYSQFLDKFENEFRIIKFSNGAAQSIFPFKMSAEVARQLVVDNYVIYRDMDREWAGIIFKSRNQSEVKYLKSYLKEEISESLPFRFFSKEEKGTITCGYYIGSGKYPDEKCKVEISKLLETADLIHSRRDEFLKLYQAHIRPLPAVVKD